MVAHGPTCTVHGMHLLDVPLFDLQLHMMLSAVPVAQSAVPFRRTTVHLGPSVVTAAFACCPLQVV